MGSIVDFPTLKSAVYNWTDRTPGVNADSSYEQRVEDGIQMFEAYFNRKVKAREMVTTTVLTTSSGSVALPTDFQGVVNYFWNGSPPTSLDEVDDDEFETKYGSFKAGPPEVYLIRGPNILTAPYDDTASVMSLVYYQSLPSLSAGSPTNWLITKYPDVYLKGTLAEMTAYAKDAQTAQLWKGWRDEIMNEIWLHSQFYRGPAPGVRPAGPTP